jgi:hypothetical protein
MQTQLDCARPARRRAIRKSGAQRSHAEALEPRRLLTALTVNGTSDPDTITVSTDGTTITIVNDGVTTQFADSAFNEIDVIPMGDGDLVNVNSSGDNLVSVDFAAGGSGSGGLVPVDQLYVGGQTTKSLAGITSTVHVSGLNDPLPVIATIDDINGTIARTYSVGAASTQWTGSTGQLTYGSTVSVNIAGGSGGDEYDVGAITGSHATLAIAAGSGNDLLTTSTNHKINATDDVQFDGGGGSNTLLLDDSGTPAAFITYSVTASVAGYSSGANHIQYAHVSTLNFFPSGAAQVSVLGTNAGELVNVRLLNNSGVNLGNVGTSLDSFGGGGVSVFGAAGFEQVRLNDDASTTAHHYSLVNNAITRDSAASPICTVDGAVDNFTLSMGSGANTVDAGLLTSAGPSTLDGNTVPFTMFANTGTEQLNLSDQFSTFAGTYTIAAGTFTRGSWTIAYDATLQHLTLRAASGTNTINVDAAPGASTDVPTISGGGGNDTVNVNPDGGAPASVALDQTETLGALNASSGGSAKLASANNQIVTVNSLSIAASGATVDVSNHQLNVGTTTAATIRGLLHSNQLITTASGGTLGYANLSASSVEVRFTLGGDATLNRSVDVGDLGALATNYGTTAGGVWAQGDFDYNGTVDVGDLGALATHYGQTLTGGLAEPAAAEGSPSALVLSSHAADVTVEAPLAPGQSAYDRLFNDTASIDRLL